jgi:hypothetical protein
VKLKITPPFDSPIAPTMLPQQWLSAVFAEQGIEVVANPRDADLELIGCKDGIYGTPTLPYDRVVLCDGEPPQPEYLLSHYVNSPFGLVLTPANRAVYDDDCMAFYEPPQPCKPKVVDMRNGKICQLATYRSRPGNARSGTAIRVKLNGEEITLPLLCNLRAEVGAHIKGIWGAALDIYGWRWPGGMATAQTRGQPDFLQVRHTTTERYAFDLCWENVQVDNYVSEKFWSPVRMGTLPLYFGPDNFHAMLPPDTIVDCRQYLHYDVFDVQELLYDVKSMSFEEYQRRVKTLLDWYYSLPYDANIASWFRAANMLAKRLIAHA